MRDALECTTTPAITARSDELPNKTLCERREVDARQLPAVPDLRIEKSSGGNLTEVRPSPTREDNFYFNTPGRSS
jgi:hypothetical protein